MRLWLTRQGNGLYMLTKNRPIFEHVEGTDRMDVYITPGEPVGVRNICSLILGLVGASQMRRGESIEIELEGRLI